MTNEQRNSLFIESYYDSYFTEKKTKEEYSMDKFKKKYKFIPDKTKGGNDPRRGTIEVDGRRYNVDMGKDKPRVIDPEGKAHPVDKLIGFRDSDNTVQLPKYYFDRTKNQKRRHGTLMHEIGHSELHDINKDKINNSDINMIRRQIRSNMRQSPAKISEEQIEQITDLVIDKISARISNKPTIKSIDKRREMLKIIDEICKENKANMHEDSSEYEADAYALAHNTKPGDLKKSMSDTGRIEHKKFDKSTKGLTEKQKEAMGIKQDSKANSNEMRRRFKAINNRDFVKKAKETY